MDTRLDPPLHDASRFSGPDDADITDVVGRPRTQWRKRACLLGVYVLAVFSKRYVLPLVPATWFWQVDLAYFVALPLLLFCWGWRKPDPLMDAPEASAVPAVDELNGFMAAVIGVWLFLFQWLLWSVVFRLSGHLEGSWLSLLQPTFAYGEHLPKVTLWGWVTVIYLSLSAGLVEEFFFRKAFRQVLRHWTPSPLVFVVASSLVFGLAHWGGGYRSVLPACAVGVVFAAVYVKLNRLAPLVIAHFLVDMVLFR